MRNEIRDHRVCVHNEARALVDLACYDMRRCCDEVKENLDVFESFGERVSGADLVQRLPGGKGNCVKSSFRCLVSWE